MFSNISSNPNIVNGPWKCLLSKQVTENDDQLVNKKVKTSNTTKKTSDGTAAPVQPSTKSVKCFIKSTPSTRSPSWKLLSRIQDSDKQDVITLLTLRQPSFKSTHFYLLYLLSLLIYHSARPWSYDGMQTYLVPKLPLRKQTQILMKIVDGEDKDDWDWGWAAKKVIPFCTESCPSVLMPYA